MRVDSAGSTTATSARERETIRRRDGSEDTESHGVVVLGINRTRNHVLMTDWGTIVIVEHAGGIPTRKMLNDLTEVLVDEAGIATGAVGTVTVRLFVTAPNRAGALKEAQRVVLRALPGARPDGGLRAGLSGTEVNGRSASTGNTHPYFAESNSVVTIAGLGEVRHD